MRKILTGLLFMSSLNLFGQSFTPSRIDISEPFITLSKANRLINEGNQDLKEYVSARKRFRNNVLVTLVFAGSTYMLIKQETEVTEYLAGATAVLGTFSLFAVFDGPHNFEKRIAERKFKEANIIYESIRK